MGGDAGIASRKMGESEKRENCLKRSDVLKMCGIMGYTGPRRVDDATFLGDFSGERRYLPVKVNSENIELPIMYDVEKFPILETITREEHRNIVQHDFEGAIAEAVYLYENKLHDFYLPKELRTDLDYVIQTHKSENRHVQNFLDFMEWKSTKSSNHGRNPPQLP